MSYKILTTHVGSLPRSKELSNLLFAKDKKESFNQNDFNEVVRNSVVDVVKKQSDIGIDIVSDGEMSKISYATYVKDRINGFSGESERRVPADLEDFPEAKLLITIRHPISNLRSGLKNWFKWQIRYYTGCHSVSKIRCF